MKERIKLVRKEACLTQTAFGERIGVKGNTVTGWETGIRIPSEAIINSISREFNINRTWLRYGVGPMTPQNNQDSSISAFMNEIMSSENSDFRRRLISVMSTLSIEEWQLLEKIADKLRGQASQEIIIHD